MMFLTTFPISPFYWPKKPLTSHLDFTILTIFSQKFLVQNINTTPDGRATSADIDSKAFGQRGRMLVTVAAKTKHFNILSWLIDHPSVHFGQNRNNLTYNIMKMAVQNITLEVVLLILEHDPEMVGCWDGIRFIHISPRCERRCISSYQNVSP
jgi:hypothetical protein